MSFYKKYYFGIKDYNNNKYEVEIHESVDTTPIAISVVTYNNSNAVLVVSGVDKINVGDTINSIGSGFPASVTVQYINQNTNTIYVNATSTTSNPPATAYLVKQIPTAIEVKAGSTPVVINYNNDTLFNPVRGSGADVQLISTTDRMFLNLYTEDMQKYQLRIYKEIQVTPVVTELQPFWFGYLDSENYSEDFSRLNNYQVNFTANDGFNLLERISYLSSGGTKLQDFQTQWETLLFCLDKLQLPYNRIYVGLSTSISGVTLATGETIFHRVYINNLNWYDEDQEPETCRKVIESILKPYAAFIIQQAGSIYILDNNYIANDNNVLQTYLYEVGNTQYLGVSGINFNLGNISPDIIRSNKIDFEVESGINKQVVKYSPYNVEILFQYKSSEDKFSTSGTTHYFYDYGAPPAPAGDFDYIEQEYVNSQVFTKSNNGRFVEFKGIGNKNFGMKDQYLKIKPYENFASSYAGVQARKTLEITEQLPSITNSDNYKLKLQLKIKPTSVKYGNQGTDLGNSAFKEVKMHCDIIYTDILGNQYKYIYWYGENDYNATEYWSSNMNEISILQIRNKEAMMNDQEIELKKFRILGNNQVLEEQDFLIPIQNFNLGSIKIIFYDYVLRRLDNTWFTGGYEYDPLPYGSVLISELKFSIVDALGNEIPKEDLEYTSKLNSKFSNEGSTITNYLGANTTGYPLQRGNLMYKVNSDFFDYLTGLTRNNHTDTPERLLLRSIKSNQGTANVRLNIDLLTSGSIGYYTYTNYLPYKKLVVLSNKLNLKENTSYLTLRELHVDNAIIES